MPPPLFIRWLASSNTANRLVPLLQATHHIDSEAEDVNTALQALGGAKVILCTTGNAKAMDCVDGESSLLLLCS